MNLQGRLSKLEHRLSAETVSPRVHGSHAPGEDPRVTCRTCKLMREDEYRRFQAGKSGWPPHVILDI